MYGIDVWNSSSSNAPAIENNTTYYANAEACRISRKNTGQQAKLRVNEKRTSYKHIGFHDNNLR
jgi:hypothetical protein